MKIADYISILLLVLLDQLTKFLAAVYLKGQGSVKVINNFFYLTYAENKGAAWSILEGETVFFVIVAACAVILIINYLNKNQTNKLFKTAMILVCSGAIGNVVDRIIRGSVIDFLDFYIFGYDYPVFNFADCCITIGVVILFISMFTSKD